MSVASLEERITPELKWHKIEEIPNFPLSSFDDVKHRIEAKQFGIGIDFGISTEIAQGLYGRGHGLFHFLLASTPFIVGVASLVLALALHNYWLLAGVVLGFAGQLLSNPYVPVKRFWELIVGLLFLVFVCGLWQGKQTMTYLSAFFIFPFFINRFLFRMSQIKLMAVALGSEKVFIFLYQIGKLTLRDNSSEQMYWHREK